ncbi:Uncharacterised protein [Providencia rustigianii]|nr:Uncharacterised protein [Providencia rustigianii]
MRMSPLPKYSSISISIPANLKDDFLLECKQAGLDAVEPIFLSVDPPSTIELLFETLKKSKVMVPKLIEVLHMFMKQRNVKIEVSDNKKIIELSGYSEEEVRRLLEASEVIQISHKENDNDTI